MSNNVISPEEVYKKYSSFMHLCDGFMIIDRDYNIIYMDRQIINMYGEGVGKKCYNVLCGISESHKDNCPVKLILRKEGELKNVRVFKHERKDRYDHWFESRATLDILDNTDNSKKSASQIMVMRRNVTECKGFQKELKEKNATLKQKNKQLESFVYTVSHDLKSPVFSMKGLIGAFREDYGDNLPDEGNEYLQDIESCVDHMGLLIRDLLELSRIGRSIEKENVPMSEIIDEVLKQIEYLLKDKNIELIIDKNLPIIFCDKKSITLVLNNLLDNAIKFTAKNPNPRIEVHFSENDEYNICSVCDNGIGINKAYFNKIFDIFQSLNEIEYSNSTGVGLTIVKSVIEVHDGKIWLESEPNKGTTFYFQIPKINKKINKEEL